MKFGFVAKHRGIWPVEVQCEALGVSRSGFYAWGQRPDECAGPHRCGDPRDHPRELCVDRPRRTARAGCWTRCGTRAMSAAGSTSLGLMRQGASGRGPGVAGRPVIPGCGPAPGRAECAGSAVHRDRAESEMGGGLHLHLDERGLALRGRRARSLLPPRRRLVDAVRDDQPARDRRAAHGGLAPRAGRDRAPSLGSGQPVHQRSLPAPAAGPRRHLQHESLRQRLGQLRDGELLLDAQDRTSESAALRHSAGGTRRHVRLHRTLLQSHPETLDPWQRQPRRTSSGRRR